ERPAAQGRGELAEPRKVGRAGRRVHEPALNVPHLDEPELRDVAGDGRLDGVEACFVERIGQLRLRRELLFGYEAQNHALPFELPHESTSSRTPSACSISVVVTINGGVRRRTSAPAVPTSKPRSAHAETTSAAGRSSSAPSMRPAPRTSRMPGSAPSPSVSTRPFAVTVASNSSVSS